LFWNLAPNKGETPAAAEKAFRAAVAAGTDPNVLVTQMRAYADFVKTTNPRFVLYPSRWLKEKGWLSDWSVPSAQDAKPKRGKKAKPVVKANGKAAPLPRPYPRQCRSEVDEQWLKQDWELFTDDRGFQNASLEVMGCSILIGQDSEKCYWSTVVNPSDNTDDEHGGDRYQTIDEAKLAAFDLVTALNKRVQS
jgi:hypothetical protein